MAVSIKAAENKVWITVTGVFDLSLQRDFRNAYRSVTDKGIEYHVNLSGAEYMDSSALGMLLLLREFCQANSGGVVIESPSPEIRRILSNAKFDRLFSIVG